MNQFSYLSISNADYIDEVLQSYLTSPESVDESWRRFFEGISLGSQLSNIDSDSETFNQHQGSDLDLKIYKLIESYRQFGRFLAKLDPLKEALVTHPLLSPSTYGISDSDLSQVSNLVKNQGVESGKIIDLISKLKQIYCNTIALEFSQVEPIEARNWLIKSVENGATSIDIETQKHIYNRLSESELLEKFLHTRYVAQKRFSIEGGESLIPAFDCIFETSSNLGASEVVLGMAHRGRLNTLVNVLGKKPEYLFTEFEGTYEVHPEDGEGDVKYHMGYSRDLTLRTGKSIHLSLGFNPSHLEFINPVIEGKTRAKQDFLSDKDRTKVLPIVVHGDSALAGQGVCYETQNMMNLKGYTTGGTIHIILNNQIGYTTLPTDSRSSAHCTDIAKVVGAPVIHVNGDSPEAVWAAAKLASEFRQKFHLDIYLDIICYRRYGHNEGDEPAFTQPLLYAKIKTHPTPRDVYGLELNRKGVLSVSEQAQITESINAKFNSAQIIAKEKSPHPSISAFEGRWKGYRLGSEKDIFTNPKTNWEESKIRDLSEKINSFPAQFKLNPKLTRFFEMRHAAVVAGKGLDWGNGENLAFATLLKEGFHIRISGQDAQRGTFSHRHCYLHDYESGATFTPLQNLKDTTSRFEVYNSSLSETSILGFEFGYAIEDPKTLTIWEAQFGDFANGAQVIIDQFLASSESKWRRCSGLTLLLPHGFEGQGPEHSSARIERFLQLCGRNNMIVCNLSTPSQIFHALRRQLHWDFRKPLIIPSPKSLLRNPLAVSSLSDFTDRGFQEVIDDPEISDNDAKLIKKVAFCTGKIYYDLVTERNALKRNDVALIRVEQLYPWPAHRVAEVLKKYPDSAEVIWIQEEPKNMGSWYYLTGTETLFGNRRPRYIGRQIAAAPAVGSPKIHVKEQRAFLDELFLGR